MSKGNNQRDMFVEELVKNKLKLQVLTDTGWSNFDGVLNKGQKQVATVQLENYSIRATLDHKVFGDKFNVMMVKQLRPGVKVQTTKGIQQVVSVNITGYDTVYDLLNVEKNNRFYANGILCSNCEFIIYDETLINPIFLTEMAGIDPLLKQGQVRWYKKPSKHNLYCVALDPSLGTGGDPAAIQILEMPTMMQIGEWQHNKTPVQQQVKILAEIVKYIADEIGSETDIYYSVENNTLGEAALIAIDEYGEENIKGVFLSEPGRPGATRRYRKGFNTTHKTKISACSKMKNLIETRKLHIASKALVSELKVFVASGSSFAAKLGETDDLVMSMLLAVRMAGVIRDFDPNVDEKLKDDSELVVPMPFIMLS